MPDAEVVSDTSPLLNLALIGRLDLLESQFQSIAVPEQVWRDSWQEPTASMNFEPSVIGGSSPSLSSIG